MAIEASDKNRLTELDALIIGVKSQIQTCRSNITNRAFVERSIADYEKRIAWCERQIASLRADLEQGPERLEALKVRLVELTSERRALANRAEIEKLLKLHGALQAVSEE